ncbi:MAG: recombination regulator RecX [Candidatus Krumholzibacteria bacterium]|nr:recombination regulator RecX [Candidatus Krumholzibacteria bacterium]
MSESVVELKPRPRNRVFIRLSGGRFFTVPEPETYPLEPGSTLSDEDIDRLARVDQYFRGKDKALRLLAIRPRTRQEIYRALEAMGLLPAIQKGIVADLQETGLIDDLRFTRDYVRNRMETKGFGPHRLKFDLKRLGVGAGIVEKVFAEEISGERQEAMAWDLVRKKLASRRPDEGDIRRLGAHLRRKGLDYEIINRVMYRLLRRSNSDTECE